MSQTTDGPRRHGFGLQAANDDAQETETPRAIRAQPSPGTPPDGPRPLADSSPVGGPLVGQAQIQVEDGGLVEREAEAALAALAALRRCAHFGRDRPELVQRLADALSRIDDALAGTVRELYGNADESE